MAPPRLTLVLDLFDGSGTPLQAGIAQLIPSWQLTDAPDGMTVTQAPVQAAFGNPPLPAVTILPTDAPGPQPSGWSWLVKFQDVPGSPQQFHFMAPAGPAAFTCAAGSPAVFTWTPTAELAVLPDGTGISLAGGSLPAGFTAGTPYFVTGAEGTSFSVALTPGGMPLAAAGSGSGTVRVTSYSLSALTPVQPADVTFTAVMPVPSGTAAAGAVPVATGAGNVSRWAVLTAQDTGADTAGAAAAAQAASLQKSANLSDLASAGTARANLGLGTSATHPAADFDTAGAASSAQAAAQAYADAQAASATTAATALSLQKSANLSDLTSAATARTSLGLDTAATHPAADFDTGGAAAAAQAASLQKTANLGDLASAGTARANLGLGTAAVHPAGDFDAAGAASSAQAAATSSSLQKASNLTDLASAVTARVNLGLGSAAVAAATDFDTAGAASTVQAASAQKSANLSDLANAATARANLGLGTAAVQAALTAGDASAVIGGTGTAPTVTAGPLDQIAALHPPASAVAFSGQKAAGLAHGTAAGDAVTYDQLGSAAFQAASAFDTAGAAAAVQAASAQKSANLSDLADTGTARANLGLGTAATHPAADFDTAGAASTAQSAAQAYADGTFIPQSHAGAASGVATLDGSGHVPAAQLALALQTANSLSDVASASAARGNLGLGSAALLAASAILQAANNLSDLGSASTARTNLGLGTAATHPAGDFDTAGAASTVQAASAQKSANLSDLASAGTARTNLGLGSAATASLASLLQAANNLADLGSASTARTNLGLGTAAVANTSAFLQPASNLSDVSTPATALANLGGAAVSNTALPLADAITAAAGAAATAAAQNHQHPRPDWRPADHGLITWTQDTLTAAANSTVPVAGTLYLVRVHVPSAATVTNILTAVTSTTATLTASQCFAGLWTAAGAQTGITADQSAAWNTSGLKTMALAGGPFALSAGDYYIGLYANGSVLPNFARGNNQVSGAFINAGLASAYRVCTANTGLTTTPPPTLGALSAGNFPWWLALS